MNDHTPHEREAFGTRLRAAVPTEPDLAGLATRAESGARSRRRRRRAGVATLGALAVASVVAAPQLIGSRSAHDGGPGTPHTTAPAVRVPAQPCSGRPDHHDFTTGTAAWVTFCFTKPEMSDREVAHFPRGALVNGADSLVAEWQRGVGTAHSCPFVFGATPFTVRVGFADGTTSQLSGDTGACQTGVVPSDRSTAGPGGQGVYNALMTALGRQDASAYHDYDPPGPPPTCPPSPVQAGRLNHDGYSHVAGRAADLSGVLLALPAVDSLLCRYDATGRLVSRRPAHPPAEPLRLASGSSLTPRPTGFYRARGSVVVAVRDRTDDVRTFTITGPDHLVTWFQTADGAPQPVGYAGSALMGLTHLSR